MYSRVMTASLFGLDCEKVWTEADVENGLYSCSIVGLANQSIRESKERIRSAITNCGYEFPDTRITVNLTPAGMKKEGSHFDLSIAIAILLSSGELTTAADLDSMAFLGELTLDGKVIKANGLLPMIIGLRNQGVRRFVIPLANLAEASLVKDVEFFPIEHLSQIVEALGGWTDLSFKKYKCDELRISKSESLDFADIKGQEILKRAALIAAAGFHGMLIIGPPGVGKSMIGKRIPGIMPKLNYNQQLEVTQIYSIAGMLTEKMPIITERPFRSPHHCITATAMVGGGVHPMPGEVSLAHKGVLFLDELPEFPAQVIETLRQPMEDGVVSIVRAAGKCTYPSSFMLVAAMNPCKCGYYGDPIKKCTCSESDRQRYLGRISGPLLDRIDLHVQAQRPSYSDIIDAPGNDALCDTKCLREKVERALSIQRERYSNLDIDCNAALTPQLISSFCALGSEESELMSEAFSKWNLSARSYHRILRLSRTIADLDASSDIKTKHLLEAFSFRMPEQLMKDDR